LEDNVKMEKLSVKSAPGRQSFATVLNGLFLNRLYIIQASDYGLDTAESGFESGLWQRFFSSPRSDRLRGPYSLLFNGYRR
jgi:hypothetical protein